MKYHFFSKEVLLIYAISILSCKAQTIIVPLGSGQNIEHNQNYYEKDINNVFGKFEGEWVYQNGTTEITLKLKKEEHYLSPSNFFTDMLVGEYQYIDNGIEKVNTLADFDNPSLSGYDHRISGGVFVHQLSSYCIDNSALPEIKIELMIANPNDDKIEGRLILRYVNDNGTEKLEICIFDYTTLADDINAKFDIPDGFYVFVKQ
jgi:hypothetical protein